MKYSSKNKKKQGFTLIELLAVIVILAVIALIATPIIMGVINDAKKGAAKDSMYSYVKAVELATTRYLNPDSELISGTYTTKDGNLYSGSNKVLDIALKGTKPANDNGDVLLEKGQVKGANLKFDGYCISYDGEKAINKDSCEVDPPSTSDEFKAGDDVYYNPVTNKKCIESEVNNGINAVTGCLKWNVITSDDESSKTTVNIQLNHNTTSFVKWVSKEDYIASGGTDADYGISGANEKGPITAIKELQADVASWHSSIKSTVRLITGKEVANIAKDATWPSGTTGILVEGASWLYSNLSPSNTADSPTGYWTSTASVDKVRAWNVVTVSDDDGNILFALDDDKVGYSDNYGIRPVITISKSIIK